jgi:hypothetical protein
MISTSLVPRTTDCFVGDAAGRNPNTSELRCRTEIAVE